MYGDLVRSINVGSKRPRRPHGRPNGACPAMRCPILLFLFLLFVVLCSSSSSLFLSVIAVSLSSLAMRFITALEVCALKLVNHVRRGSATVTDQPSPRQMGWVKATPLR